MLGIGYHRMKRFFNVRMNIADDKSANSKILPSANAILCSLVLLNVTTQGGARWLTSEHL
jgi:hypothetical protein